MADKKKTLAEMIRGSVGEASIAAMDAQAVPESGTGRELTGTYAKLLAEQYAAVVDEYLRGGAGNG